MSLPAPRPAAPMSVTKALEAQRPENKADQAPVRMMSPGLAMWTLAAAKRRCRMDVSQTVSMLPSSPLSVADVCLSDVATLLRHHVIVEAGTGGRQERARPS